MNREQWLNDAAEALRPILEPYEPPKVHISVGFANKRSTATLGQCWQPSTSADGHGQIFISPAVSDPIRVMDILLHELVHAVNHANGETGHGKAFRKIAVHAGLTGKMTSTTASPALVAVLEVIADKLGPYPHPALSQSSGLTSHKKQSTRMLPSTCPNESGYKVRLTAKWLGLYGHPICPCCDERMV